MNLRKIVGQNIRVLRKEKGLTQEKLAWSVDLTSDYVGNLERGQVNVSLDALGRIAKCLGVEPDALLKKSR